MDFDGNRYSEVLRACSLDFDISKMTGGDMAFVGEKGFNLSGGQRARLALARWCDPLSLNCQGTCLVTESTELSDLLTSFSVSDRALYRDTEIYLLDDILSAVDAHVGRSILHNAILGPPMNQQTRILCTHNIQVFYSPTSVFCWV